MKKIIISLAVVAVVGAIVVGATTAFFSDTETSRGNTFTAGAIDLKIDNTSYYNGNYNSGTSWLQAVDLTNELFFDFRDLKPGDYGEDTISIHVDSNDAYACVDVRLDSDDDNGLTEPESVVDSTDGAGNGELADHIDFIWWVDDGDNVLEVGENLLLAGPLGNLAVGQVATVALAEPESGGVFGGVLLGGQTVFLAKAWCFGTFSVSPVDQDNKGQVGTPGQSDSNGPDQRGAGFTCDGSNEGNETQTDSMTATISFMAVQARNNDSFSCSPHLVTPTRYTSVLLDYSQTGWAGWSCPIGEYAVGGGVIENAYPMGPQGIAEPLAIIGDSTYPVFPHYTFDTGETGYVAQNGGTSQTAKIFVDCLPKP